MTRLSDLNINSKMDGGFAHCGSLSCVLLERGLFFVLHSFRQPSQWLLLTTVQHMGAAAIHLDLHLLTLFTYTCKYMC